MNDERSQRPEWAHRIRKLIRKFGLTQKALATQLGVSPATVSRWVQGKNQPTPEAYVALGNLDGMPEGVYFWERAGVDAGDRPDSTFRRVLQSVRLDLEEFQLIANKRVSSHLPRPEQIVAIPLLKLNAWADAKPPAEDISIAGAEVEDVLTAPLDWCSHAESMIGMHLAGDSMFPTIADGAIIVIDTAMTDRDRLDQQIVVVSHRDSGFKVARLQRLSSNCYLLVSANHKIKPVDITNAAKWKIYGQVLWWVSRDSDAASEQASAALLA